MSLNKCKTHNCKRKTGTLKNGYPRTYCSKCTRDNYKRNSPHRWFYDNLRSSARRRGKVFTLTFSHFEEILIREKFILRKNKGEDLTIDRIKNELGYEDGNIQVLTRVENTLKEIDRQHNSKIESWQPMPDFEPF